MRFLEMHIEVADLERSVEFYSRLLPHAKITRWKDGSAAAFVLEDGSAFGLWVKGKQGLFKGRGAQHLHFAFQVTDKEYEERKGILDEMGLELFEHIWPKGGKSIYFFDPDGHQGEFMTIDWFGL
jgi:catechol 2,3-dioxygenase-like lactoylglutathione lyase family enzyme